MKNGLIIGRHGSKLWYKDDKLHNENGPAIIYDDGKSQWYLNGKLHREDGPAVIYSNGDKVWALNGEYHRVDGPAFESIDGDRAWFLYDEEFSETEFNNHPLVIALKEKKFLKQIINEVKLPRKVKI